MTKVEGYVQNGAALSIDPVARTIQVSGPTPEADIYSTCKHLWRTHESLLRQPFPWHAHEGLTNGWSIMDAHQKQQRVGS